MDISELVGLVGNNAFSIVMCLLLFKYMTTKSSEESEKTQELLTALKEEQIKTRSVLDRIIDLFDKWGEKLK